MENTKQEERIKKLESILKETQVPGFSVDEFEGNI